MKKTLSEILYSAIDATSDEINSIKDSFQEKFNVLNNDITTFTTNIKNNYCSKNKVNKTLSDNFYSADEQNNSIIETSNNSNDVINKTFNDVSNNITNNYSTKTDMNNFQNSVNQDIVKQFSTISSDTTQTINAQYGTKQTFNDTVTTLSTNTLQSTVNNVLNTDVTYNNSTTNNTDSKISFKKYIDDSIFTNRSAKIGYLDNDIMANISASYNMNAQFFTKPMVVSDIEGREWAYVLASNTYTSTGKIYRGYRMNENSDFSFGNDPVIPPCIKQGYYISYIYGMGSDYMICNLTNGSLNEKAIINTKYTGNINTWEYYLDISSLNYDGMISIYYDENLLRIGIFYIKGQTINLRLYDESLKLISDFIILDLKASFFDKQTLYNLSDWGGNGACCYIPSMNKILIVINQWFQLNIKNTGKYSTTEDYAFPFLLQTSEDIMTNGKTDNKPLQNLMRDNVYDIGSDGYIMNYIDSASYGFIIDDLKNQIIFNAHWQDRIFYTVVYFDINGFENLILSNKNERTSLGIFYIDHIDNVYNFLTDDTCPWAKYISSPVVLYDNIYFGVYSKKYDYNYITANIKPLYNNSNKLGIRAGEYVTFHDNEFAIYHIDQFVCNYFGNANYNWTKYNDGYVYDIGFEDFHNKDGSGNSYKAKPNYTKNSSINEYRFPTDKFSNQNVIVTYYDSVNKKHITFLQNLSHSLPKYDKEGMGYFVIQDENSMETVYIADSTYQSQSASNYDTRGYHGEITPCSNMFCMNGCFYVGVEIHTIGGAYMSMYKYDYTQKNFSFIKSMEFCYWPNQSLHTLGYNNQYGFYFTDESYHTYSVLYTSKDIINNQSDKIGVNSSMKDIDSFLTGNNYANIFEVEGSSGLIAFIQSFPIYLGGYYSIVNSKEIYLKANSKNYVYAERDAEDISKINVSVLQTPLTNINPFKTVLLSVISTNAETTISQNTYGENEILGLDKRIAIMEQICKRNNIK